MLILLDNRKKGDKLTVTRDLDFGKGKHTQICKIAAVWDGKIMLGTGETFRYYSKN